MVMCALATIMWLEKRDVLRTFSMSIGGYKEFHFSTLEGINLFICKSVTIAVVSSEAASFEFPIKMRFSSNYLSRGATYGFIHTDGNSACFERTSTFLLFLCG